MVILTTIIVTQGRNKTMRKKLIGIFVIMLFLGVGVLPTVYGNGIKTDYRSTDVKDLLIFVGTIKVKQELGTNAYSFLFSGLGYVYLAGNRFVYLYSDTWIGFTYELKIGIFGDNIVCAIFYV